MDTDSKPKTLRDWIHSNYEIIVLLGVFGGLVTLFNSLYISHKIIEFSYLSLISLLILLLLDLELLSSFPNREEKTVMLQILEILFASFLFLISVIVMNLYKDIIPLVLPVILMPVYIWLTGQIFLRVPKFKDTRLEDLFRRSFVVIFFIVVIILMILTKNLIDYFVR